MSSLICNRVRSTTPSQYEPSWFDEKRVRSSAVEFAQPQHLAIAVLGLMENEFARLQLSSLNRTISLSILLVWWSMTSLSRNRVRSFAVEFARRPISLFIFLV